MASLSLKEREVATNDLHGVSDLINEVPEFVHEKLNEMRKELSGICQDEKKAYDMLLIENDQRVQSNDYLVAFLRADCFDASKAALRMTKYLNHKLNLFGKDNLSKPITIADLGANEVELLERGWVGVCPLRDMSSRRVVYLMPGRLKDTNYSAQTRVSKTNKCQVFRIFERSAYMSYLTL